jgi:hypothetical protein
MKVVLVAPTEIYERVRPFFMGHDLHHIPELSQLLSALCEPFDFCLFDFRSLLGAKGQIFYELLELFGQQKF